MSRGSAFFGGALGGAGSGAMIGGGAAMLLGGPVGWGLGIGAGLGILGGGLGGLFGYDEDEAFRRRQQRAIEAAQKQREEDIAEAEREFEGDKAAAGGMAQEFLRQSMTAKNVSDQAKVDSITDDALMAANAANLTAAEKADFVLDKKLEAESMAAATSPAVYQASGQTARAIRADQIDKEAMEYQTQVQTAERTAANEIARIQGEAANYQSVQGQVGQVIGALGQVGGAMMSAGAIQALGAGGAGAGAAAGGAAAGGGGAAAKTAAIGMGAAGAAGAAGGMISQPEPVALEVDLYSDRPAPGTGGEVIRDPMEGIRAYQEQQAFSQQISQLEPGIDKGPITTGAPLGSAPPAAAPPPIDYTEDPAYLLGGGAGPTSYSMVDAPPYFGPNLPMQYPAGAYQQVPGYPSQFASGGMAGAGGPELAVLGEEGPELVLNAKQTAELAQALGSAKPLAQGGVAGGPDKDKIPGYAQGGVAGAEPMDSKEYSRQIVRQMQENEADDEMDADELHAYLTTLTKELAGAV